LTSLRESWDSILADINKFNVRQEQPGGVTGKNIHVIRGGKKNCS
jgi:hypothetical protein